MLEENTFIDTIMEKILDAIMFVVKVFTNFVFSERWITFLFWYILVNFLAIILMKKDKKYAETDQRRIRESTLILVALAGGGLGMYYAMYKYKHKTLHKKFTIFVPISIVLHFACVSYLIMSSFLF